MGDDIVMLAFRIMIKVGKVIIPAIFKTGLIYPMALSLIAELIGPEVIPTWLYVLAMLLCYYLFIQSIVRLVKKDKKLKLYQMLLGRHRRLPDEEFTNPRVNTSLSFSEPSGVVFGRVGRKWVAKPENVDSHILIIGGPGSGKSACIGIPSCLTWGKNSNAPVFAIDIKGELHAKTRHCRPNSKVFSLTLPDGYGYNPFYLIDEKQNIVQQMKDIAIALCPISPEEKSPFWKQSAQSFICGVFLWAYRKGISFAEACEMIQAVPPQKLATAICEDDFKEPKLFANQFCSMAEQTLSGVYAEVSNVILPFATDEQLRSALSKPKAQCISPSDLDNGTSIYISLDEFRIETLRNFLTLLVNQFLKHFEKRPEGDNTRVLFLLDELPRLGRIDSLLNGLATLRSKNVCVCCIIQSFSQLDVIYGQAQRRVICDNCSYWAILRITDPDSQQYVSKAIGTFDKTKKSYSENQQDLKLTGSSGTSTSTENRPIFRPEELGRLDDELILLSPFGFNRVRKEYYFRSTYFQKLLSE